VICGVLLVIAIIVILTVNAIANMGPGFPVKDICELDGQTFSLTENIILT
jgi:hypothetical protein